MKPGKDQQRPVTSSQVDLVPPRPTSSAGRGSFHRPDFVPSPALRKAERDDVAGRTGSSRYGSFNKSQADEVAARYFAMQPRMKQAAVELLRQLDGLGWVPTRVAEGMLVDTFGLAEKTAENIITAMSSRQGLDRPMFRRGTRRSRDIREIRLNPRYRIPR